ncbi:MAG: ABC transporter substrate-binding protein [Actinomycetota bacterium]
MRAPLFRRRRFLLAAAAGATVMPLLPSCDQPRPLVTSLHSWVGYETLVLAREFGWLPAWAQLRQVENAGETLALLKSGAVDAGCLTLDEVLRARAAGVPLTVVLVFDVSAGADMVLARPGIESLADLAGKRLGLEEGAVGALVLAKLLEVAGLPPSALTLVDLPPDRQVAAWQAGQVDAVVTFEPTATLLRRQGARLLFDSRQMPDTIFDVLAVRRERASDRAAMRALVGGHFRALDHIRASREDAVHRIATHQGVAPEEVRQQLGGIALPSLAANRGYLVPEGSHLLAAAAMLSTLMTGQGLLPREDALDGLVSAIGLPSEEAR